MYGLISQMKAQPGQRDGLVALLLESVAELPGCRGYVVALDNADPDGLWITELWEDEASHDASLSLPLVQQTIARARPLIAGFGARLATTPLAALGCEVRLVITAPRAQRRGRTRRQSPPAGRGRPVATAESGETQMATVLTPQDLPRLQSEGLQIVSKPWVGMPLMLFLTTTRPPTDDLKVRQAVEYGIDRDALVSALYQGIGAKAIGPLTAIMLDDPSVRALYPHDLAKAGQLLDQSGWTPGADGIRTKGGQRLEFSLNAIDYGAGPDQSVELIQGQLRQVGMDVRIKTQARPPWYEDNYHCANNGMQLFLRGGELDVLYAAVASTNVGGNFNWSCVKDAEIDNLLDQGRRETDAAKRKQVYLAAGAEADGPGTGRAAGGPALGIRSAAECQRTEIHGQHVSIGDGTHHQIGLP
jgi:quinol monooxygenase YgiN